MTSSVRPDSIPSTPSLLYYSRTWSLEGIQILSRAKGGDGRTVEAYAAVFNKPQEILDRYGHYNEIIDPRAFNDALKGRPPLVLYNHGRALDGKTEANFQVPIGKPLDIKADQRGLLTVTRYNAGALADAVLASIANGDITAQSFEGGIYHSDPSSVPRVAFGQPLPTIRRLSLGLKNYGPTPIPAYDEPMMVAVRSARANTTDIIRLRQRAAHINREMAKIEIRANMRKMGML